MNIMCMSINAFNIFLVTRFKSERSIPLVSFVRLPVTHQKFNKLNDESFQ